MSEQQIKVEGTVKIWYPIEGQMGINTELDRKIKEYGKRFGWEEVGGGSGFGTRDLEFRINQTIPV